MYSAYLTKSDFKACFDCRTKLYYRKRGYPSVLEEDEYLRFLADGGFMVEYVAKAAYPGATDLAGLRDREDAFRRTGELVAAGDCTIFEAAAIAGKFHARTDILQRSGRALRLVEVKSSSVGEDDPDASTPFVTHRGGVNSKWRPYLLDLAFQTHVVRLAFPGFAVKPYLCVVDKTQAASADETLGRFRLSRDKADPRARPTVTYSGNAEALRGSRILRTIPAAAEVDSLMPEVLEKAGELADLLEPKGVRRRQEDIGELYRTCRTCEFRFGDGRPDGFRECWGALADAKPHILDLYRVGQIRSADFPDPVPGLLAAGRASLLDLGDGQLGKPGPFQERRFMQWRHSRDGTECVQPALPVKLGGHTRDPGWPLHFVDFEACDVALPHHAGLRPYERVAFQWSCHTVTRDGRLEHAECLNLDREFPNFAFARTLGERLGNAGTVYVWSPYEQTTLGRVLAQLDEWAGRDPGEAARLAGLPGARDLEALSAWIRELLGPEDLDGKRRSPRIRDLHDLALRHYFHPLMGGRTSIKAVLPAVWQSDPALRSHPWFSRYLTIGVDGRPLDPYDTLEALPFGDDDDGGGVVREGVGAIRAYQDLVFASADDPQARTRLTRLLLQYCRLDTAAMVMIWMHWTRGSLLG